MDDAERASLQRSLVPRLVKAWDSSSSETLLVSGGRFVQWAGYPAGLQIECVSNRFLPQAEHLSEAEVDQLRAGGWQDPSAEESPNFWQRFLDRDRDVPAAAAALARAIEVLGGDGTLSSPGAPERRDRSGQPDEPAGEAAWAPPHSFASDIDGVRHVIVLTVDADMDGWSVETTRGRWHFSPETVGIAGSPNLLGYGTAAQAWTAVCHYDEELIRFLPPGA